MEASGVPSSMTRIKVSGITRPEDAAHAASLGVDYVSCIFSARSPRYTTIEQALDVREALPPSVSLVGVFVDTPTPLVQRVAEHCHLDYVQLFGAERRGTVDAVRSHAFKAVTVSDRAAAETALRTYARRRSQDERAPGLLLHFPETVDDPWSDLPPGASRDAVVLAAAALATENAEQVVRQVRPWCVDVWDAVEEEPGVMDHVKLEAFVVAVRAAGDGNPETGDA
jgi:phosphoribosylanthranilate isomerase